MSIPAMAAACGVPSSVGFPVRRATVTTAEVWAIPDVWKGRYVCFRSHGSQVVHIRFGTADTVSVSASAVSGLAAGVLSANATPTEPHIIVPSDGREDEYIDSSWTHLAHISAATTGFLCATLRTAEE